VSRRSRPFGVSDERAAVVVLASWGVFTVVELLLALRPTLALVLTVLETAAIPAFSFAVLALAKSELAVPEGDGKPRFRTHWVRSYGLHALLLLLISGSLAGQYQVIHAAFDGQLDPHSLSASYRSHCVATFVLVVIGLVGSPQRLARLVAMVADQPARLMAGTFGLAVLVGTLLLALPLSLNRFQDASLLDALFTSVSAVCVTGLTVYNVADTYSTFGQAVILALMQGGGLGIMVLTTFFAILGGRRLQTRRAKAMAELLDVDSLSQLKRSLFAIVVFTLAVELLGAVALYLAFDQHPHVAAEVDLVWAAVFHAVSAFCNAGFTNLQDGMIPFGGSWSVMPVLMLLITAGGLGFPVALELAGRAGRFVRRQRQTRLSLHSRVVLVTSGLLLASGTGLFFVLEYDGAMQGMSLGDRILAALFQSVTCRTAGFSTIDFGAAQPAMLLVACGLMFVGASPGSAGGGIKTTTVAVLYATLRAELLRKNKAELGDRSIGNHTVRRAVAVGFMALAILATVSFLLLWSQEQPATQLVFEAVSAMSTAGLSTGITADLTWFGKITICVAMFMGRIGPLTLALVVANRTSRARHRLVEERIAIG